MASAIADFAAKQKEYNQKSEAAIDGIVADINGLNDKIALLQSTQGQITTEDQQILDGLQADGLALATKIGAVDDMRPPTPPTV